MAEATIEQPLHVKHNATNMHSTFFGAPTGEIKTMLENLGPRAKKDRLAWLGALAWHKLPEGPYPMHFTGYGWMKVYLIMDEYHAVYIPRDDLNLDVEILKIRWARDGMSIEARQHFTNFEELLDVKIVMHSYDAESNQLKVCLEQMAQITYNQVRSMIRNEVENWPRYDEWYNERIQADRDIAEQKAQESSRKKSKKASRKTKRRLSFPVPKKKRSKATGPKATGPKVRVVTALDHANDAHEAASAKIMKTMAAQKVLRNETRFLMTLQAKPLEIAAAIFLASTKEELQTIALELARQCKQNDLENIMLKHRDAAIANLSARYQTLLSEAITANDNVDKLRAQSYGPIEDDAINEEVDLGPNAEDGPDVQDAAGPNLQDVLKVAFGTDVVGPNKDAADGPKDDAGDGPDKDAAVGPKDDAGDGPIDLTTPKPFVAKPHYVRSTNPRSSSGYKGVVKDKRGTWRAKWSGKHIGRYEDKGDACQAYYDYCLAHGYSVE